MTESHQVGELAKKVASLTELISIIYQIQGMKQ